MGWNRQVSNEFSASGRDTEVTRSAQQASNDVSDRLQRMSLVASLLRAIVRADGEVLVLHVGDRPYVVAPSGQIEVATRPLTTAAVDGIVSQLLPEGMRASLDELGAAQHELTPIDEFPRERFMVVVARSGTDLWAEIRRKRVVSEVTTAVPAPHRAPAETEEAGDESLAGPDSTVPGVSAVRESSERPGQSSQSRHSTTPRAPAYMPTRYKSGAQDVRSEPEDSAGTEATRGVELPLAAATPAPAEPLPESPFSPPVSDGAATGLPLPAVVLPLSRSVVRPDAPPPLGEQPFSGLDRLLRVASARGASVLYVSSGARPSIRVDGVIQTLEGAPVFEASDVDSLLLTLVPERHAEALRRGLKKEWSCDVAGVGRVRCLMFRDQRGAGCVVRLLAAHPISAEQLGLTREIQALVIEREGLVLVCGPHASGKRTLIAALVDLINRSRRDYVVTIEREITLFHASQASLVSQRHVPGTHADVLVALQGALREDPDVVVVQELQSKALVSAALEAASSRLIIGTLPAPTTTAAVDYIIDLYPPEERRQVQLSLAHHLCGVVAQVLLPKTGGGRLAARELLLRTPAVATLLLEGRTSQLPLAIEGGRKQGMVPLNDAIVGFVQNGAVDVREAYRRSVDRAGFLALLRRQGLDTSFAERLA